MNLISENDFTTWQLIKAVVSDKLLELALKLLPTNSIMSTELAKFLMIYLSGSINRNLYKVTWKKTTH